MSYIVNNRINPIQINPIQINPIQINPIQINPIEINPIEILNILALVRVRYMARAGQCRQGRAQGRQR